MSKDFIEKQKDRYYNLLIYGDGIKVGNFYGIYFYTGKLRLKVFNKTKSIAHPDAKIDMELKDFKNLYTEVDSDNVKYDFKITNQKTLDNFSNIFNSNSKNLKIISKKSLDFLHVILNLEKFNINTVQNTSTNTGETFFKINNNKEYYTIIVDFDDTIKIEKTFIEKKLLKLTGLSIDGLLGCDHNFNEKSYDNIYKLNSINEFNITDVNDELPYENLKVFKLFKYFVSDDNYEDNKNYSFIHDSILNKTNKNAILLHQVYFNVFNYRNYTFLNDFDIRINFENKYIGMKPPYYMKTHVY